MKRIISIALILIMLTVVLAGCGAGSKGVSGTNGKEVISQLTSMQEKGSKPKEMFDYLNQNISGLNKEGATEALGILVSTMEEYETTYNDQLYTGNNPDLMYQYFELQFDYNKIANVKEKDLKDLLYDITWGGYKVVNTEGSFMVVLDYDSLKTFSKYVNDELKSYIDIMSLRFDNPASADASTVLPPEDLAKRILEMENYIMSYDNKQREEIMISMYEGYLMVYMSGSETKPVFDADTQNIYPERFKNFEDIAAKNKDKVFGKVLGKYVELLKQENFANTEKVQDFILNLDTAVVDELAKAGNK
jgi:hypothetical protein